ncbi:MAG TPA: FAD/NAD(P)-binding oxidoreductase [Gemmatimonadaceae bacterium]|nr:FAD/NAD(P)-binding oxidoreductase [Gemmatimonadaceae bacterium]
MMKRILILGGGTAGTMMAAKLVRMLPMDDWTVTVVDQDDQHVYQPGLLFVPFGGYTLDELVRPRSRVLPPAAKLVLAEIDRIVPDENRVTLKGGESLPYDFLIIATGSRIVPAETEGLMGEGWRDTAFDFYTLDGAGALSEKLRAWKGGRLVVNVVEMPIKCPVAPLEFLFLAEAFFTRRGMRDKVEIVYATPLDGAFTKKRTAELMGGMLKERGITVETLFNTGEVDGSARLLKSWDGREVPYDLLVTIPTHRGSAAIATSGLGNELDFVPTDKHTLQSKAFANVFVIGDATDLSSSKAGSVAHFQAEVLTENLRRAIAGEPLDPGFDGHANCFIETGYGKATLIDFNYDVEPLPGKFPLPVVGPFSLLEETTANHWGKLAFKPIYWNVLLKGHELPTVGPRMRMAGKRA